MDRHSALLWMENVSKSFPGVQALDKVNLHIHAGEVLGLIGQNGAGKSTLMKILSGVYTIDSGEIYYNGQPLRIHNPHHAQELGISIIYQELNLMPNLSVMENIFMGREPGPSIFVNRSELERQTRAILERMHMNLRPSALVRSLSVAEQQMVEIAKAISRDVRVLIMDEPTSALSEAEVETLFEMIGELKRSGVAIIFISHRLEEVLHICDRVTVLRDGRNAGDVWVKDATREDLIRMMVGRSLEQFFHRDKHLDDHAVHRSDDVVLEVRNLSRRGNAINPAAVVLDNVSFTLRRGEILGLAGLVGAGRTELVRAIFGADRRLGGRIFVEGREVEIRSPVDAIRLGIGLVPEDRKAQGLILSLAVRVNMTLANLGALTRFNFVRLDQERRLVEEYIRRFDIRTPSTEQRVVNLSGGNQQKVVIAKWLMLNPKILIMDEPTRGIDVGAKSEIYELMHQLAVNGISIIMISSEFPELLAMCDRIICLAEGRVTAELSREEADLETLMHYCTLREQVVSLNQPEGVVTP
ncbi:MAG: sugar ABC transporter ATP-binding protein [Caldilinea sp.]|nr:sugar ABC transporter ATP-binding protein [Caldilinea sp.]MDW8441449.1 sugar ABC transporter ATP-binding protein [Caldilineaceae bacterium]